jgi:hypothetical protein
VAAPPPTREVLGTTALTQEVRAVPDTGRGRATAPGAGEWLAIAAGVGAVFLLGGMRVARRKRAGYER